MAQVSACGKTSKRRRLNSTFARVSPKKIGSFRPFPDDRYPRERGRPGQASSVVAKSDAPRWLTPSRRKIPPGLIGIRREPAYLAAPRIQISNSERTYFRVLATWFVRGLHQLHPLRKKRAQGKPGADCTRGRAHRSARVDLRLNRIVPAFPAQWVTAYSALSPVTGLCCHRRLAD